MQSFPNQEKLDQLTSEHSGKLIAMAEQDCIYEEVTLENKNVHEGTKKVYANDFSGLVECSICNLAFYGTNATLDNHMKYAHNGQKNYSKNDEKPRTNRYDCESCGKSFSGAGSLKTHTHTIHEGHKDYKCELCGKSFSQKHSLKIHIHNVHEGSKDHKCDSCHK